ncbi:MAG: MBL fold metallo-hydrolase [Burkholderiales bacterium]
MRLTFYGAAQEVTGSCFLVETGNTRFLVDCGLFQGGREADAKNRNALDFEVERIDFVLLTHAHLDHSGLLPRLVAFGYSGPIYTIAGTGDLLEVMLADAAFIQERESDRRRNRREPLYTVKQAEMTCRQVRAVAYGEEFQPHPSVRCRFRDAGHILGSAIIETWVQDGGQTRNLVFSGDIGQPGHPIVEDPDLIEAAEILLVESTYGNRQHKTMDRTLDEFVGAVRETIEERGGNVIVPAFAVGRTQEIIYLIVKLHREGRLPEIDIYVDSPMALAATEVTLKHMDLVDEDAMEAMRWLRGSGGGKPRINFVQEFAQSQALSNIKGGALIISASGMCDAGRIRHHLRRNLPRAQSAVVFTGFQAAGTLGRRIVDGAKSVRIFGEEIRVRAAIHTIGGLSAHADRAALLNWLRAFRKPPRRTFVVHGEVSTAHDFAQAVRDELGWKAEVPPPRTTVEL